MGSRRRALDLLLATLALLAACAQPAPLKVEPSVAPIPTAVSTAVPTMAPSPPPTVPSVVVIPLGPAVPTNTPTPVQPTLTPVPPTPPPTPVPPTPQPVPPTPRPTPTAIPTPSPIPQTTLVKVSAIFCWTDSTDAPPSTRVGGVYVLSNDSSTLLSVVLHTGATWTLSAGEVRGFEFTASVGSECLVQLSLPTDLYPNGARGDIHLVGYGFKGPFLTIPANDIRQRAEVFLSALARGDEQTMIASSCCQDLSRHVSDLVRLIAHRRTLSRIDRTGCSPRFGSAPLPSRADFVPTNWWCGFRATFISGSNLADAVQVNITASAPAPGGSAAVVFDS